MRGHGGIGVLGTEVAQQLGHVVGKAVAGILTQAQRAHHRHVAPRRAPEAKVDAAGIERRERAELLGHGQRRVVGQHDAARADAHRLGEARHMADQHRGRGGGDALHVVMLGQPVAVIAERLGVFGQRAGIAQRLRRVGAFGHRSKVENGIVHAPDPSVCTETKHAAAPCKCPCYSRCPDFAALVAR